MSRHRQEQTQQAHGPGRGPRGRGGGYGPRGIGRPVEKAKDFKGTVRRLLRYMRPHRLSLAVVFLLTILSTLFGILSPKIMGRPLPFCSREWWAGCRVWPVPVLITGQ